MKTSQRVRVVTVAMIVSLGLTGCGAPTDDGSTGLAEEPRPTAASVSSPATAGDQDPTSNAVPSPTQDRAPATVVADPTEERPPADSPDARALADGLNQAGARMFLAAAENEEGDLLLSPFSIGVAFGMADVGAAGPAADGLAELFGYPVQDEERWSAFNTLLLDIATDPEATTAPIVALANRQFPDLSFTPQPAFAQAIATWFGAAAQPLPLQQDQDGSRQVINDYVAQQTRDRIPELLPQGFITPASVLVLVNALYLEAKWTTPFGKYPTTDAPFTLRDGTTTTVPLMNNKELFGPAVQGEGYVAAELPYRGDELSMTVIVPDDGAFDDVQQQMTEGLLDQIDTGVTDQAVDLYLPRFTSTTNADLQELIEGGLGINGIFYSPHYPGIAEEIALTSAVHAADIEVDEEGTVAAAATALGFEDSGPGPTDLTVRADRPFLYAIRHIPTGAVLFLGRVMDPFA
ncbi:serpin family protein [soil metagenome]